MANYYNKYQTNYNVGESNVHSFSELPPPYDEEEKPAPSLKGEQEKALNSSNKHEEAATKKSWWHPWRFLGLGEDRLKVLTNEKAALDQQVRDGMAERDRLERELEEVRRERDRLKDALAAANGLAEDQRANIRSQDRIVGDMREEMGYLKGHFKGQIEAETRAHRQAEEAWREREKQWNTERGRWRRTLAGVATRNVSERGRRA